MFHGAWARRAGSSATRLVLTLLLTSCLVAATEAVLAGRLAVQAVERDTVARTVELARQAQTRVEALAPAATDPAAERALLDTVLAELAVTDGTARAVPAPATGDGPAVARAGQGDTERLVVTAPVSLPSGPLGVEVTVDAAELRDRAAPLHRSLLLVIGSGALATVPLVLALGGLRLLRRHRQVVLLAGTDELTGTGNRRAFATDLDDAVEEAHRSGTSLAVVLAELAGLSSVTSTVGRRRADGVLAEVGQSLLARHPGHVYRLGGEVFAVLLRGIGPDQAFALADLMRTDVGEAVPPLTLTLGVAGLDARCPDTETLVIAADAALDEARALGGNRVVGPADSTFGLRWVANRPAD